MTIYSFLSWVPWKCNTFYLIGGSVWSIFESPATTHLHRISLSPRSSHCFLCLSFSVKFYPIVLQFLLLLIHWIKLHFNNLRVQLTATSLGCVRWAKHPLPCSTFATAVCQFSWLLYLWRRKEIFAWSGVQSDLFSVKTMYGFCLLAKHGLVYCSVCLIIRKLFSSFWKVKA